MVTGITITNYSKHYKVRDIYYNCNCNHGDYCHDNSSEELVHTLPIIAGNGPTVNMEMSLMNQSEDDAGGQEEKR